MSKILILEDDPNRMDIFRGTLQERHEIISADNAIDFIKLLQDNAADVIFLDHDLGGQTFVSDADKNTGSEVVRFLTRDGDVGFGAFYRYHNTPIIIHSHNFPAAERMQQKLEAIGYSHIHRIPFSKLVEYLNDPGFII
jgi:CheY-like chemotaxis protein